MRYVHHRSRDSQRLWPAGVCTLCGGALYPGERYWQVNGVRSCEGCLGELARREFAGHAVVCGEEGAL